MRLCHEGIIVLVRGRQRTWITLLSLARRLPKGRSTVTMPPTGLRISSDTRRRMNGKEKPCDTRRIGQALHLRGTASEVARATAACVRLSIVVFVAGTVLIWISESGQKGGSIHGFGDAAFFCSVQLLTISSSMTNPLTPVGKVVDVGLEVWGVFVITVVAGSFATFFTSGDSS